MLYRIVQEITNNALKHSKASCLAIFIACENDQIKLKISDNGVGFDVNHPDSKSGVGLRSIFDRVGQMNGTVDLQSDSRQGTRFSIVIPC
jgi:signal transduction histidine kinase